jgi:hypothetical protein
LTHHLTIDRASAFARMTLGHLGREYPYKLDLVLNGPEDAVPPRELHPIFHGSFDWHSCVHGWWQVMRLWRLFPDMPEAAVIRAAADRMLVPEKVAGELAYLSRPNSGGFERPYGWAWLLALHHELARHDGPWADALAPLADAFAARFHAYLAKLTYPLRVGTHFNTSFALVLARDWAETRDPALVDLIDTCADRWFGGDLADPRFRVRPHGRQDRAPRRAEPQPRLVPSCDRGRAARRACAGAGGARRGGTAPRGEPPAHRRQLHGRALAGDLRAARPRTLNPSSVALL